MKLHKNIVISIITVVLLSCNRVTNSGGQSSIPTPDIGNDVQVGNYLVVTAPNGWNTFKNEESISLEIRNISKGQINSGLDFGARIFVRTDQGWIEVKNKTIYGNGSVTLDPSKNYDPLKTAAIFVRPDLPDYSVPYDIRIFVIGDLMESGKEPQKVASYIDLSLAP